MTDKQLHKVHCMAFSIFEALDLGYEVIDEFGNEVLGLRRNSKLNPESWSYLFNNKHGHLTQAAIRYTDNKKLQVSKKFTVNKAGKKPTFIR